MKVVQHTNAQLVGLDGIVVKASEHVVHVVTKDDRHVVVSRSQGSELTYRVGYDYVVSMIK
jgi:RNase P/RNase MRP subunit p29